jgi:hypothetical protein
MKKLCLFIAMLSYVIINQVSGQWSNNVPHIYNTNSGNVGIGNGTLWAPTEKLHVNTFGASIAGIMAENSVAGNGTIGYLRIKNTASGYVFNMVLRKVNGNHEMLQSCYDAGAGLWREYAYYNFATRKYEMRTGVMDAEFLNSGKFLISSAGNTGIGIANPLEKLDVNGGVRLGNTTNNNTGAMRWNGSNFQGNNGSGWVNLDVQQNQHCLIEDAVNSIFMTATTNYTVPSGKNLLITAIHMADINSDRVTINSMQDICYYGTRNSPIMLSPSDQIDIIGGGSFSGQLIPFKYTTVYQNVTGNPYTVPSNKNLVIWGVFTDCMNMSVTETYLLQVDGATVTYLCQPEGLAFPLVINGGMVVGSSNVSEELVISGYLIDN